MKFPNSFTKVTKFSKIIALIIFISLPFVGFVLGIKYQKAINLQRISSSGENNSRPINKGKRFIGREFYNPDFGIIYSKTEEAVGSDFSTLVVMQDKEGAKEELLRVEDTPLGLSDVVFPVYINNNDNILLRLFGGGMVEDYVINSEKEAVRLDLARKEYKNWEEIVGWADDNQLLIKQTVNDSDPWRKEANVVRYWIAPYANLENRRYLD